eukprot:2430670-Rhodomonas_salina.2
MGRMLPECSLALSHAAMHVIGHVSTGHRVGSYPLHFVSSAHRGCTLAWEPSGIPVPDIA